MDKSIAAIAVAGVATFVGAAFLMTALNAPADRFEACRVGTVAGGDIGGPFALVSETGEVVTDQDVITGPTLIYFGYTFCPDVCPMDTDRNATAVEYLDEQGVEVTPVFITVDPATTRGSDCIATTALFDDGVLVSACYDFHDFLQIIHAGIGGAGLYVIYMLIPR